MWVSNLNSLLMWASSTTCLNWICWFNRWIVVDCILKQQILARIIWLSWVAFAWRFLLLLLLQSYGDFTRLRFICLPILCLSCDTFSEDTVITKTIYLRRKFSIILIILVSLFAIAIFELSWINIFLNLLIL